VVGRHSTEEGLVWSFVQRCWRQQTQGPVESRFNYRRVLLKEPCVYCGNLQSDGMDHIVPKSQGGKDGWYNRAPACWKCDKGKSASPMLVFLVEHTERRKLVEKHHRRLLKRIEKRAKNGHPEAIQCDLQRL
jgi:5-methylcytosine-specific restriction endonuclease McrA